MQQEQLKRMRKKTEHGFVMIMALAFLILLLTVMELCLLVVELQSFRNQVKSNCRETMSGSFAEAEIHLSKLQQIGLQMQSLQSRIQGLATVSKVNSKQDYLLERESQSERESQWENESLSDTESLPRIVHLSETVSLSERESLIEKNRNLLKKQNESRLAANQILKKLRLSVAERVQETAAQDSTFQIQDFQMPAVRLSVTSVRNSSILPIWTLQEPFMANQAGHASWSIFLKRNAPWTSYRKALWTNLFKKVQDTCRVSLTPIDKQKINFQTIKIWEGFY